MASTRCRWAGISWGGRCSPRRCRSSPVGHLLGGDVEAVQGRLIGAAAEALLVVADLAQDLAHVVEVDVVVELVERRLRGLVTQAHVPAVGQGVVVEAALLLVDVDADVVDQAVGRAAGVLRAHPRHLPPQIGEHLVQPDIAVAVEVDEADLVEDPVVAEDLDVERARHLVGDPVVDLARRQHRGVDLLRAAARRRGTSPRSAGSRTSDRATGR